MIGEAALVAVRDNRRQHDWYLIGSAVFLMLVGIAAIHSHDIAVAAGSAAKRNTTFADKIGGEAVKQAIFGIVGVLAMVACSFGNIETWQRLARPMWWINNLALLAVKLVGHRVNGSQRWIAIGKLFTIQPSDFANVFVVLTLATFFIQYRDTVDTKGTLGKSFLHVLPSVVLIALQPHYGGAACLLVAWLCVSLYSGAPPKRLLIIFGSTIACLGAILASPPLLHKVFHGFQADRIIAMIDKVVGTKIDEKSPDLTPEQKDKIKLQQKEGYQQTQAELAIAMGGVTGEGYLKGERKAAQFIPEQESDFVFSIIGEEFGFIGSFLTIVAIGFFLFRVWLVIYRSRDPMAQMIGAGFLGVLAFHAIINLAMVMNISVTVGLWLPLMSSGGSALITCLMMVGILDGLSKNQT